MVKRRVPPPVHHAEVAKRRQVKPSSPATAAVPLLDVPMKGLSEVSMSMEGGRLRVVADVGVRGVGRRRSDV